MKTIKLVCHVSEHTPYQGKCFSVCTCILTTKENQFQLIIVRLRTWMCASWYKVHSKINKMDIRINF